jgi:hypothetical protein
MANLPGAIGEPYQGDHLQAVKDDDSATPLKKFLVSGAAYPYTPAEAVESAMQRLQGWLLQQWRRNVTKSFSEFIRNKMRGALPEPSKVVALEHTKQVYVWKERGGYLKWWTL